MKDNLLQQQYESLKQTTDYYQESHKANPTDRGFLESWLKCMRELRDIKKAIDKDPAAGTICLKCGNDSPGCPRCQGAQCSRCGCVCKPTLKAIFSNGNSKKRSSRLQIVKASNEVKQKAKQTKIAKANGDFIKATSPVATMKTSKQLQNQKDYERYKQQYRKLLESIDPDPKCAECSTRERLEINHIFQVEHDLGSLSHNQQLAVYRQDIAQGKCNILCRSCNAKDGAKRLQGKALYKTK